MSLLYPTTAVSALVWETSTDWNNAVSESGVVHQSTPNTDHNDDTVLKKGHDYGAFGQIAPAPDHAWPLHEDSGTTANDVAGASDGTFNGVTLGQTGLLGTTAPSLDGTDDYIDLNDSFDPGPGDATFLAWVNNASTQGDDFVRFISNYDGGGADNESSMQINDGILNVFFHDGSDSVNPRGTTDIRDDSWHLLAAVRDGTTGRAYVDGTEEGTDTNAGLGDVTKNNNHFVGRSPANSNAKFEGRVSDVRFYSTALTATQIQTLYDVVNTNGSLETATKSFASAQSPDLVADVALNGVASFDVDVIGSPAGSSETNTVTVDTNGENTYTITWASSHTDFRVKPKPAGADAESTATIDKLELTV